MASRVRTLPIAASDLRYRCPILGGWVKVRRAELIRANLEELIGVTVSGRA
ncbi:hypothetical protein [Streptosporangium sp. NPDC000396]|uniref:hypothetical protein n=1 Tax=Streptosporangium sp. NPDC000396 TaxID=3366185 RepID=UPI0036AD0909